MGLVLVDELGGKSPGRNLSIYVFGFINLVRFSGFSEVFGKVLFA